MEVNAKFLTKKGNELTGLLLGKGEGPLRPPANPSPHTLKPRVPPARGFLFFRNQAPHPRLYRRI